MNQKMTPKITLTTITPQCSKLILAILRPSKFIFIFLIRNSNAVNGMINDFNDDLNIDDDMDSRNKFEEVCLS
jgi:hypothetical protein